jgi:hypothetical protein
MIYTYRPFFLLTLLHPSHSFFTELRTFMPRICGAVCSRRPLKRDVRSLRGEGRESALQAQVGVWMCVWIERVRRAGRAKSIRRRGRRSERGSILAVGKCVLVAKLQMAVVELNVQMFRRMGAKKCTCVVRSLTHVACYSSLSLLTTDKDDRAVLYFCAIEILGIAH